MDKQEREAQRAVGLEKEFRVRFLTPVKTTVTQWVDVRAVNEEDAKEIVADMINAKTDKQILFDCEFDNRPDASRHLTSRELMSREDMLKSLRVTLAPGWNTAFSADVGKVCVGSETERI